MSVRCLLFSRVSADNAASQTLYDSCSTPRILRAKSAERFQERLCHVREMSSRLTSIVTEQAICKRRRLAKADYDGQT